MFLHVNKYTEFILHAIGNLHATFNGSFRLYRSRLLQVNTRKLLTRSARSEYFCTAQTSKFSNNSSNVFTFCFSKQFILFSKCCHFLPNFDELNFVQIFANVLRKWKQVWICAEIFARLHVLRVNQFFYM